MTFKKLKSGAKVSSVIIEHDNNEVNDLRALCILLGAYNVYGRKIQHKKYEAALNKFNTAISNIKHELLTS